MIVLAQISCPECRVRRPSCDHKLRRWQYVVYFDGKATMQSPRLDDAKTFKTVEEATEYYRQAVESGVTSIGWEPKTI